MFAGCNRRIELGPAGEELHVRRGYRLRRVEVKATDADMIALPAFAILLTAVAATLPAVLRALRTDPTEIMRSE